MWLVSYTSKWKAPISLVHFLKLEKMTQGIPQDINPRQIEQIDILQIKTKNCRTYNSENENTSDSTLWARNCPTLFSLT